MSLTSAECTDSQSYWRTHLERHASSGLSVREYCQREGFSQGSFYNWRKRLGSPASSARVPSSAPFLELTHLLGAPMPRPQWEMEVALPCGAILRLARGFDPESLRRALEVLARC